MTTVHHEIVESWAPDLADVPFFCVSARAFYSVFTNTNAGGTVLFQEGELLDKLREISAKGRQH